MLESLSSLLDVSDVGWRDVLDIALVSVLIYGVISLLRRTRGAPLAIGILAFVLIWRFAVALDLQTFGTILDLSVAALPFVIVLLFQNTIRRALTTLGRNPLFRLLQQAEEATLVESVALAALSLSAQRVGALVAIEREVGLRTWSDSGIPLDARVSYELLLALFHPRSPLHDGAVIVSHGRIVAASCLLPLTQKPQLSVKYGSRHRAAIGLSEESDAVIVVVSEERGVISVVHDGEIRAIEAKELRDLLRRELLPGAAVPGPGAQRRHVGTTASA